MDVVNVQLLVEKLVREWKNLATEEREAASGWARDAGRARGAGAYGSAWAEWMERTAKATEELAAEATSRRSKGREGQGCAASTRQKEHSRSSRQKALPLWSKALDHLPAGSKRKNQSERTVKKRRKWELTLQAGASGGGAKGDAKPTQRRH
eukprot:4224483-Amphidinium_carterae.1